MKDNPIAVNWVLNHLGMLYGFLPALKTIVNDFNYWHSYHYCKTGGDFDNASIKLNP